MSGLTRKQLLVSAAGAALASSPAARAASRAGGPLGPAALHRDVRELCAFGPRRTGAPAERAAGAWVRRRLREAGLRPQVTPYRFRRWVLDDWQVELLRPGSPPRVLATHPIW